MLATLAFIATHPLTRNRPGRAFARYLGWQVGSRLKREHVHDWISGTKLAVFNGMTGATGNIYCGLHEYPDMGLVLHLLRHGDTFLDVGANIGSYTVLASGVCGARTLAFEPDRSAAARLRKNVELNELETLVTIHECALGNCDDQVSFTSGQDTTNRVSKTGTRRVRQRTLDGIAEAKEAVLIKLDVEGYEAQVLTGARETLTSSSLLAVETEACDNVVQGLLESAGFVRRWYDPSSRLLSPHPLPDLRHGNALFVRSECEVLTRIAAAPTRSILGQAV